ncbi:MAG: type III pantothenate kinase [Fibrobacterota bacterium]
MNIIAVDEGNSRVKIARMDIKKNSILEKRSSTCDCFEQNISQFLSNRKTAEYPVVISSVRKNGAAAQLQASGVLPARKIHVCSAHAPLFETHYSSHLGIDRYLAILETVHRYPRHNCVVIDAGTALTIEIIEQNARFTGGYILPGPFMKARSLQENTDLLPETCITFASIKHRPPQSTQEAISAGILFETLGGIEKIISHSFPASPPDKIITTGGFGKELSQCMEAETQYDPDLVLYGIARYFRQVFL